MNPWLDFYGRSFFFFLTAIISYICHLKYKPDLSVFNPEDKVRWLLSFKIILMTVSLSLLSLAVVNTSLTTSLAAIFGLVPILVTHKLNNVYIWVVEIGCAVAGLVLLYNHKDTVIDISSTTDPNHNDKLAYIQGFVAAACFAFSCLITERSSIPIYIHPIIDTIYFSLFLTLVIPACLLTDYSINPVKFVITW